ncbi:MAG: peptide chain release factor N(5)-glutamine methyltransferase [Ilumatobacteraceae bacterium]
MTTVRELVESTSEVLGDHAQARWLVEVAVSADHLEEVLDEDVTERMVAHLDAMVGRYRTGEPLQYVLGRWAFRHLDLFIDQRVLIPRPETEEVAGVAIEFAKSVPSGRTVIDLGTGSGAIGLSLAYELPLDGTSVWITDVSADALDVARANLAGIGRPARNVTLLESSWFNAVPAELQADVIVSNPPYIAEGSRNIERSVNDYEPAIALYSETDGLGAIREIIQHAGAYLKPGGVLVLEIGFDQASAVRKLLVEHGFADEEVRVDAFGKDRIAIGRWNGGMK